MEKSSWRTLKDMMKRLVNQVPGKEHLAQYYNLEEQW